MLLYLQQSSTNKILNTAIVFKNILIEFFHENLEIKENKNLFNLGLKILGF